MHVYSREEVSMNPSPEYLAENNASTIVSVVGVFGFLALVIVSLRLYVRGAMLKFLGADDLAIALSMAIGIALFVCFIAEAENGLGRHYQIIAQHLTTYLHWEFAHALLSLFGIAMVKISVSLLLLRLVPHKHYRWFLWGIITFLSVYTVICAFTIIYSCNPVSANWDVAQRATAKCFSIKTYTALGITNSDQQAFNDIILVFTMLTDAILAILPIPIVMKLQINRRTRTALSMVLSLGFIAVACGAVKIYYQYSVLLDKDSRFKAKFFTWAALEFYLGIIACSLPSLRPLVAVALKSARSTLGVSSLGTVGQTAITPNQNYGLGYRKYADTESTLSDTLTRNSASQVAPPLPNCDGSRSPGNPYYGVKTLVAYDVEVERSFSDAVPLDNLSSPTYSTHGRSLDAPELRGIVRTTKVITRSETMPTPPTPAMISPYGPARGDYFSRPRNAGHTYQECSYVSELPGSHPGV